MLLCAITAKAWLLTAWVGAGRPASREYVYVQHNVKFAGIWHGFFEALWHHPLRLYRPRASDSMRRHRPHPIGLKPTLRHMMIVILWAALVLAVLRMLMLGGLFVAPPQIVCLNVATIVAAWPMLILAVLILALDRWGPVRDWYFACCQIAWSALAGVVFLLVDPVCSSLSGQPTAVFPVLPFLGVACLWGGTMQLRAAWPGACPRCGHRTIIATRGTVQVAARGRRNMVRGWCATCGAAYQREGLMAWRPEAGEAAELDFPDVR